MTLTDDDTTAQSRILLIGAVAIAAVLFAYWGWRQHTDADAAEGALHASSARLTLEHDDGRTLETITRRTQPELWYRVVLDQAPLGGAQHLRAEWRDPRGSVVYENAYETKVIDHVPWETHVRYRLRADAPEGRWRVTLLRGEEVLQATSFVVD